MGSLGFSTAWREALLIIAAQAAVTLLLALLCWLIWGDLAGQSALIGGSIGTLGSLVQASFGMRRLPAGADPQRLLAGLYRGELFCVYAATFVAYWLALARTSVSGSKLRAP